LPEFERKYGFVAGYSTHQDRLNTIRAIQEKNGVLIDPHTADGVKVAAQYVEPGIPMLVLETALPAKFSEVIQEALGVPAPVPAGLENLESLPQKVTVLPCDVASVRAYITEHASV
jgi:threonine synthase